MKGIAFTAAAVMCLLLAGCAGETKDVGDAAESGAEVSVKADAEESETTCAEEKELSQKYEGSYTEAFMEKLEADRVTLYTTVVIGCDEDEPERDSYKQLLEANGEDRHYKMMINGLVSEVYKIGGKTWAASAEDKGLYPLEDDSCFGPCNENTVFGSVAKDENFISAKRNSDGNIEEVFEAEDGWRTVYTYNAKTGMLLYYEKDNRVLPGDAAAAVKLTVNSFEEYCGEIKLPEGYTIKESQIGRSE